MRGQYGLRLLIPPPNPRGRPLPRALTRLHDEVDPRAQYYVPADGRHRPPPGGFMRRSLMLVATLFASVARAQQPAQAAADSDYATSDVMIPMRDGVRLHPVIVTPKNATAPLPILMERTPYGTEGFAASVPRRAKRLGLDGYIHVEQDIRGRFGSEGAFDMNRPPHSGHAGTDESSDTYDTIDWLLKNVPNNNGKVGVFGISYPGWLTAVAGVGAAPAPQGGRPPAPVGRAWMGDGFFHPRRVPPGYSLPLSPGVEGPTRRKV